VKKTSYIFLAVGIVIFIMLFRIIGFGQTIENFKILGFNFFLIIGVHFLAKQFWVTGWKLLISVPVKMKHYYKLVLANIVGDSTSVINTAGIVAGDGLKALYLRSIVPFRIGLASVVMDRTIHSIGGVLVFLTGIIISFFVEAIPLYVSVLSLLFVVFLLGLFVYILKKQKDGVLAFVLDKLPTKLVNKIMNDSRWQKVHSLDKEITNVFEMKEGYSHFYLSLFLHYIATLVYHTLEVYLVVYFIDKNVNLSFFDAAFIFVIFYMVVTAAFFMPGNMGTGELAYVFAFKMLGLDGKLGLTVAIVNRLRVVLWAAVGTLLLFHAGLLGKKGDESLKETQDTN